MRFFLIIVCLLGVMSANSQTITTEKSNDGITIRWKNKKQCKYMYVQRISRQCTDRPMYYYTPVYSCNGKTVKKKPAVNFKDEIPVLKTMMDTLKRHMPIDFCMVNFNIKDYDDLMIRLIDSFASSEEWKKALVRRKSTEANPNFEYGLVLKVIKDEKILDPIDEFLGIYNFRVARAQIEEKDIHLLSKKELKRLGRDQHLLIPLPDPLWIQVSQVRR